MANKDEQYVRRCPSCFAEHAPDVMRCSCGVLLVGVDLTRPSTVQEAPAQPTPAQSTQSSPQAKSQALSALPVCPHQDCAQPNPPGSERCLYCDRPLIPPQTAQPAGLLRLPATLAARYHVVSALPAQGAEAELLLVQAQQGGPVRVAKIYRSGIAPELAVQQRIATIDERYRVAVIEQGSAEGHAYEVMEYCAHGSWRTWLKQGAQPPAVVQELVRQLAQALAAVHAARLVHRDLKPENILVRSSEPLHLVLADFGIASVMDATQRFTDAARTLGYAAPESLSGVIDQKADYWALGMIVLETTLGRHPFAGLSDAVVLHHLTTRAIDLTGVADASLRKLLRGLLQRDPAQRWGGQEVARWLARDPALPDPAQDSAGFAQPYHLGEEQCATPTQLALALARHWHEGCADIENGQLLAWFREVQKDQNTARLLIALRHESQLAPDMKLLRLILHLAPTIAPVWKGDAVGRVAVLQRANQALHGDQDAGREAVRWLDQLYHDRVLDAYAQAGNQEAQALLQAWNGACEAFQTAWKARAGLLRTRLAAAQPYANVDTMLYGGSGLEVAPLCACHAALLASAHDPRWVAALREKLAAEMIGLAAHCPWLAEWGDVQSMEAAALVAVDALLPQAKKLVEAQAQAEQRARDQDDEDYQRCRHEMGDLVSRIKHSAKQPLDLEGCEHLRTFLERYFELLVRVRAGGQSNPARQELSKALGRHHKRIEEMLVLVDELAEQRAANQGWFSAPALGLVFFLGVLLPRLLGPRIELFLLGAALVGAAWRVVPAWAKAKAIRDLASEL